MFKLKPSPISDATLRCLSLVYRNIAFRALVSLSHATTTSDKLTTDFSILFMEMLSLMHSTPPYINWYLKLFAPFFAQPCNWHVMVSKIFYNPKFYRWQSSFSGRYFFSIYLQTLVDTLTLTHATHPTLATLHQR